MYTQIISMKNLFSVLPSDFFKPLNSRYKDQYADCILAIYNSYKSEISYGVDRESVVSTLTEYFNTRTTAVFTIKYLRSLGYKADNDIFAENSWYFRNALVRANYSNLQNGIQEKSFYLEQFFRNLILGKNNELKNRYTHIDYEKYQSQNDNVKITKNQQTIIDEIKKNPFVTQEELSEIIGITIPNINRNMKKLQEQSIIKRVGADKNGYWEIIKILK